MKRGKRILQMLSFRALDGEERERERERKLAAARRVFCAFACLQSSNLF